MDKKGNISFLWTVFVTLATVSSEYTICPSPETILPCICTQRNEDVQIWCTHSELIEVSKGIQKLGNLIKKELDELIIENNFLPSLPGKLLQNVKVVRLMLRNNGIERVSSAWLEPQESNLVEIYIVENDLKSIPPESLMKLQNLQALTIRSNNLKRIPTLTNMPKLIYVNIFSTSFKNINEHTFKNLPNLEKLYIHGSTNLYSLQENAFYNLPKIKKIEITDCNISSIHMRALSLLPNLNEISLRNNKITDASMVSRATRDLANLSVLNINDNVINNLNEGAFVDQPMLEKLYLSNNNINIIHHGAFHRVPKLRLVDLNFNRIVSIHPESFMQQSGSGIEELFLTGNKIMHISEFRSLLDALPRLRFLDMSDNLLQEIPRGALRGHPNLERLHLNKNNIKFIQTDAFLAMPALRELNLNNNLLSDINEGTFWNLPALKGLDLSMNYFQRLQPKLLHNLPSLRRINLSNNQLSIIDPLSFMECPMLEHVNISANTLASIHPATFRSLANLYEIDASSNRLVEFIPGLPRGLEQLYLKKNQITNLPASPSPDLDLPSLRTLDISNNGIQKIAYDVMKTLHNLRRLYIKRNGLRHVDITTFTDLQHLEVLDISDNQIINVNPNSFNSLLQLKQVNLQGNSMDSFDFTTIQSNVELSTINLSRNKLKQLNPGNLQEPLNVQIINVSSNMLNELPTNLNIFSKLIMLDASHNHIKKFDGNYINNIQSLTHIKMQGNKIKELRAGSFQDLKNLQTIDLKNNQIENIYSLAVSNLLNLLSVYLSNNHIIDIPEKSFSNLPKVQIIELQGNRLQYISMGAFENVPILQYLNLSNNQLTSLENSGITQLTSLEVLDVSFNHLKTITKESFQYMEWLVELNLDSNSICNIIGQPFDFMPRLKVLSMQRNKLSTLYENSFTKLRNNIAILDLDNNPLICNCEIIWLKSWLLESSSIGPKCADGTNVKEMPFSRKDCVNYAVNDQRTRFCLSSENEALQPNLATSQIFSSLDRIKDYQTQIKNNYGNKVNNHKNRPLPQESEYFYDEYVDYPYNETLIDSETNEINQTGNVNKSNNQMGNTPTIYASMKNSTNHKTSVALKVPGPNSGFTFFGFPLPSIDMGQILGSGRKMDLTDQKNQQNYKKYQESDSPKFETGGFSPILPKTSNGFMPILNPTLNISYPLQSDININNKSAKINETYTLINKKLPTKIMHNSTTHKKIKTEIHEFETFHGNNNNTQLAYNKTRNVQEQKSDPNNLSKYNFVESNITISQVTEKENIITTDTSNDISLQEWLETSSIPPSPSILAVSAKSIIDKSQLPVISEIYSPDNDKNNWSINRAATITKVNMPHAEHYDLRNNYAPVINREAKRFSNIDQEITQARNTENNDWYYENYNKSNLEPYIAPSIHSSNSCSISKTKYYILFLMYFFQEVL